MQFFTNVRNIFREEVDLGLTAMTLSKGREKIMDFSAHVGLTTATQLYIKRGGEREGLKLENELYENILFCSIEYLQLITGEYHTNMTFIVML